MCVHVCFLRVMVVAVEETSPSSIKTFVSTQIWISSKISFLSVVHRNYCWRSFPRSLDPYVYFTSLNITRDNSLFTREKFSVSIMNLDSFHKVTFLLLILVLSFIQAVGSIVIMPFYMLHYVCSALCNGIYL